MQDKSSLQLWSPSGKQCDKVTVPGATRLGVGLDGTVFSQGGSDGCSLQWWSKLSK